MDLPEPTDAITPGTPPPPLADRRPARPRKAKGKSPTARTLDYCEARGWTAGVVERRLPAPPPKQGERPNPYRSGRTVDLFSCIDVVALDGRIGVLGIQATSSGKGSTGSFTGNLAARQRKIEAEPRALAWLEAGNRLEVWGWRQDGGKGSRWRVERREAYLTHGDQDDPPSLAWREVAS